MDLLEAEKANDILPGEKETGCEVLLRSGANAEITQRVLHLCDFIASRVSAPDSVRAILSSLVRLGIASNYFFTFSLHLLSLSVYVIHC